MISQQTIEEVLDINLADAVQRAGVQLKKDGTEMVACCPFHTEKSPSFKVNANKGLYKCYGCGEGGNNPISFWMKHKQLSYPEAVRALADAFNISVVEEVTEQTKRAAERADRNRQLADLNERALNIWKPFAAPEGTIRHPNAADFGVVYAPEAFDTVRKAMADVPPKTLFELGLLAHNEEKDIFYDMWRNRLLFPIRRHDGLLLGFGGMAITEEDRKKAKYINTKATDLFDKGKVLFAMDMARASIRNENRAYVTEGYWDVVAMHRASAPNTVASCGTAFTDGHAKLLRKNCSNVTLLFDGDVKGIAAAMKAVPICLAEGLMPSVCIIPNNADPDDLVRQLAAENPEATELDVRPALEQWTSDGIMWMVAKLYNPKDNPSERADQLRKIAQLLAMLENPFVLETYVADINAMLKLKGSTLKKQVEDAHRSLQREDPNNTNEHDIGNSNYTLPRGVDISFASVRKDVEEYGFFTYKNRIYMTRKSGEDETGKQKYTFTDVSNFSIRIIQHMMDEKKPARLVQIHNVKGRKYTFDTSTDDFVSEQSFRKMIEGKGNFTWMGKGSDFDRLMIRLKEEMGDGRMISVLGWQPEGFWAYNNRIVALDGSTKQLDEHGQIEIENTSYYMPSGNQLYATNDFKFGVQKKVHYIEPKLPLADFYQKLINVHGEHAYSAILFGIATVFSDVIFDHMQSFPLLFLYGPPGTGKDQLIHATQALFGHPQDALELTSSANTAKGTMRDLAQFRNMAAHWSEYRNGKGLENLLKGIWDRKGYKRGTIEHAFANEVVPVLCSLIFTGNDYPVDDALIDRMLALELTKDKHTEEELRHFNDLKETIKAGISGYMVRILPMRPQFENEFWKRHKEAAKTIKDRLTNLGISSRMVQNAATLLATYRLSAQTLALPFTEEDYLRHLTYAYSKQMAKRSTGSITSRFWECFLAAIRDRNALLRANYDFRLEGNTLTLQWSSVYQAYQVKSKQLFSDTAESRAVMDDALKKSSAFVASKDSVRFSDKKTSGWQFNADQIGVEFTADLINAMEVAELNLRTGGAPHREPTLEEKVQANRKPAKALPETEEPKDDDMPF